MYVCVLTLNQRDQNTSEISANGKLPFLSHSFLLFLSPLSPLLSLSMPSFTFLTSVLFSPFLSLCSLFFLSPLHLLSSSVILTLLHLHFSHWLILYFPLLSYMSLSSPSFFFFSFLVIVFFFPSLLIYSFPCPFSYFLFFSSSPLSPSFHPRLLSFFLLLTLLPFHLPSPVLSPSLGLPASTCCLTWIMALLRGSSVPPRWQKASHSSATGAGLHRFLHGPSLHAQQI